MGWGMNLYTDIYYSKLSFSSKYDVEDAIEMHDDAIKRSEKELTSLALITEPKKFCDEESDPIYYLQNRVEELVEIIKDNTIMKYKLELLLDTWDITHDKEGKLIPEPKEAMSSYLTKDF